MTIDAQYWSISEQADFLTDCHLRLLEFRNSDDSYGRQANLDLRMILTANVVQAFHALGFPLDSPRLANSLSWIRSNASNVLNAHMGKLFRLIVQRHFPTEDTFQEDDWSSLTDLIAGRRFVSAGVLVHNPKFPLLALDILLARSNKASVSTRTLFEYISENTSAFTTHPADASYLAYLCVRHNPTCSERKEFSGLLDTALSSLKSSFVDHTWDASPVSSAYAILNLKRLPPKLIKRFDLALQMQRARARIFEFARQIAGRGVSTADVPAELSPYRDAREIYAISVIVRGIIAGNDALRQQLDFAHAHLRHVYINLYDPLTVRVRKLRKWVGIYYPVFFVFSSFAFVAIASSQDLTAEIGITGGIASIVGLALSLITLIRR